MPKVALIETKPSKTDFIREFDNAFEFVQLHAPKIQFVSLQF